MIRPSHGECRLCVEKRACWTPADANAETGEDRITARQFGLVEPRDAWFAESVYKMLRVLVAGSSRCPRF